LPRTSERDRALNILLAAREARVRRVVYAGSTSAYGNPATLPNREDQVPDRWARTRPPSSPATVLCRVPRHLRARDRRAAVFQHLRAASGPELPVLSGRAAVIAAALQGEPPTIYGDGGQTRDFVHVANVVHANLLAARAPAERVVGQVINVGCAQSVSVNDLWEQIREHAGVPVLARYAEGRPGEVRDSLASIDKARALVEYQPVVDFP